MDGSQEERKNPGNSIAGGNIRQRCFRKFHVLGESGQDLIEFVIVLPLLLLVVFGVLDLGRLFHAGITITNAARVGARSGSLKKNDVVGSAIKEAEYNNIDLSSAIITTQCLDGNTTLGLDANGICDYGDIYRVTITYNFELIMGDLISLPGINLIRSAEMLRQW